MITQEMLKSSNKRIKRVWLAKAQREGNEVLYAMGRKKPRYPVPAPLQYSESFTVNYCLGLCAFIFKEWANG